MIELVKEKSFGMKDQKLQLFKHAVMFDKFKLPKFTCSVICSKSKEYDLSIYLGLNNGCIVTLKLSKQKSLFHKYDEFTLFNVKDEFKHRGPVYCMISEVIEGVSVLFSGGVDGTIKFWNTDVDDQKANHYITTIFGHKSTILSLVFSRTKNLIISSSTDMTIRVWKMKDNFDKIINPLFQNILVIKDFDLKKKKQEEKPFWINTLSLKETDIVELYAGDTKGRMHFYHFIDTAYVKSKELELRGKKYVIDNFNHMKTLNMHGRTIITVVHSVFDSMIYSIGFDNNLIGFNQKTEQSNL
jgi:WD40 repeat protein